MIKSILQTFTELVLNFSWRRFIYALIFIGLIFLGVSIFEWHTSFFKLSKLEKITNVLLKVDGIYSESSQPMVKELCNQIVVQLGNDIQKKPLIKSIFGMKVIRPFMPLWPWVLFCLFYIPSIMKKEPNSWAGLLGTLIFGFIAVGFGLLLPWVGFLVNGLLYPIIFFVIIIVSVILWSKRKIRSKN